MSNVKHHYLYSTWATMKKRCSNPNHISYKNYGGRGIKVCERWLGVEGFKNFLADMVFVACSFVKAEYEDGDMYHFLTVDDKVIRVTMRDEDKPE